MAADDVGDVVFAPFEKSASDAGGISGHKAGKRFALVSSRIRRDDIAIPAVILSRSALAREDASTLGAFAYLSKLDVLRLPAVAAGLLGRCSEEACADREALHPVSRDGPHARARLPARW